MYCYNESGKQAPERIIKVKAAGSYLSDFILNGDALYVCLQMFPKLCFNNHAVSYK